MIEFVWFSSLEIVNKVTLSKSVSHFYYGSMELKVFSHWIYRVTLAVSTLFQSFTTTVNIPWLQSMHILLMNLANNRISCQERRFSPTSLRRVESVRYNFRWPEAWDSNKLWRRLRLWDDCTTNDHTELSKKRTKELLLEESVLERLQNQNGRFGCINKTYIFFKSE